MILIILLNLHFVLYSFNDFNSDIIKV